MTVVDGLPRLLARFILLPIHGAHRKMNKSIDFHFIGFLPFVRAECCFAKMKLVCLVFYYNVAPMRVEQICKEDRLSVIYHFLIEWAALDALDNCASCRLRTHQNNKFSISFRRYVETVTIGNTFVKLGSHALCMRANCRNALRWRMTGAKNPSLAKCQTQNSYEFRLYLHFHDEAIPRSSYPIPMRPPYENPMQSKTSITRF